MTQPPNTEMAPEVVFLCPWWPPWEPWESWPLLELDESEEEVS